MNKGQQQQLHLMGGKQRESTIFDTFAPLTEKHAKIARYQFQRLQDGSYPESPGNNRDSGKKSHHIAGSSNRRTVPLSLNRKP